MPIYKQTTELTKCADWLTAAAGHDIQWVYFGDKQVFTVWGEYDGTLPATYSANGSALADYRVYGGAGGVGDRTKQLLDLDRAIGDKITRNGNSLVFSETGALWYDIFAHTSGAGREINKNVAMYLTAGTYTISGELSPSTINISGVFVADNPTATQETLFNGKLPQSITLADDGYFTMRVSNTTSARLSELSVVKGFTALASYIPYGYKLDMSVSDGTTEVTTPIYIGDTPLGEDEYVSFEEQKVYRKTENYFDGYFEQGTTGGGNPQEADNRVRSNIVAAVAGTFCVDLKNGENFNVAFDFWNNNILVEATSWINSKSYITPNNATSVRIKIRKSNNALFTPAEVIDFGMYPGSTAPEQYVPYLQPQDPPVPLPALPTVDGVNIVDYAGQSAAVPSRFVAKYRKEDF